MDPNLLRVLPPWHRIQNYVCMLQERITNVPKLQYSFMICYFLLSLNWFHLPLFALVCGLRRLHDSLRARSCFMVTHKKWKRLWPDDSCICRKHSLKVGPGWRKDVIVLHSTSSGLRVTQSLLYCVDASFVCKHYFWSLIREKAKKKRWLFFQSQNSGVDLVCYDLTLPWFLIVPLPSVLYKIYAKYLSFLL